MYYSEEREPDQVPDFVKTALQNGTAPIEGVKKGVGL